MSSRPRTSSRTPTTSGQKAKVQRHVRASWKPYPTTTHQFDHVNIDLVGRLPPSQNIDFFLTWSIDLHDGPKPSLSRTRQPCLAPEPLSRTGLPVLAYPPNFPAIGVHSLPPKFGLLLPSFMASDSISPRHTTHKQMGW